MKGEDNGYNGFKKSELLAKTHYEQGSLAIVKILNTCVMMNIYMCTEEAT